MTLTIIKIAILLALIRLSYTSLFESIILSNQLKELDFNYFSENQKCSFNYLDIYKGLNGGITEAHLKTFFKLETQTGTISKIWKIKKRLEKINESPITPPGQNEFRLQKTLRERLCYVNVIIAGRCYNKLMPLTLGHFYNNLHSTFVIIVIGDTKCQASYDHTLKPYNNVVLLNHILAKIYTIHFNIVKIHEKYELRLTNQFLHCEVCANDYNRDMVEMSSDKLLTFEKLNQIYKGLRSNFNEKTVAISTHVLWIEDIEQIFFTTKIRNCVYEYNNSKKYLIPPNTKCQSDKRLIVSLAVYFNFTFHNAYRSNSLSDDAFPLLLSFRPFYSSILIEIDSDPKRIKSDKVNHEIVQILKEELEPSFIYCLQDLQHVSFDFLYLIRPFNYSTAFLVILTSILMFIINNYGNGIFEMVKSYTAFIRTWKFFLLLFSLFVFLIFSAYECFMSSEVILPRPLRRISTINELVKSGYIIEFGLNTKSLEEKESIYNFLKAILIENKITDFEKSIKINKTSEDSDLYENIFNKFYATLTFIKIDLGSLYFYVIPYELRKYYKELYSEDELENMKEFNTKCNKLSNPPKKFLHLKYEFYKYGRYLFYDYITKMKEAGILNIWDEFYYYTKFYSLRKELDGANKVKSKPKAFYLKHWRITPIFSSGFLLIFICSVSFVLEILISDFYFTKPDAIIAIATVVNDSESESELA